MAFDPGTVVVTGIIAASNLGGVMFLAKKYAGSVDEHNKVIPAVLETLKTINAASEKTATSLDELYKSRNSHETRLVKVETVHEINGCNLPQKKGDAA